MRRWQWIKKSRSQRDPVAHVTVIDGAQGRNCEPAYHVIIGANATLDGFTITGGIAQETDAAGEGSDYDIGAYEYTPQRSLQSR